MQKQISLASQPSVNSRNVKELDVHVLKAPVGHIAPHKCIWEHNETKDCYHQGYYMKICPSCFECCDLSSFYLIVFSLMLS